MHQCLASDDSNALHLLMISGGVTLMFVLFWWFYLRPQFWGRIQAWGTSVRLKWVAS